jgi:hypothetical protein
LSSTWQNSRDGSNEQRFSPTSTTIPDSTAPALRNLCKSHHPVIVI